MIAKLDLCFLLVLLVLFILSDYKKHTIVKYITLGLFIISISIRFWNFANSNIEKKKEKIRNNQLLILELQDRGKNNIIKRNTAWEVLKNDALSGKRSAIESLEKKFNNSNLSGEEHSNLESIDLIIRKKYQEFVQTNFNLRLLPLRKFSPENLYKIIILNNTMSIDERDRIAAINESIQNNYTNLVGALVDIALNDKNLFVSVRAAQAVAVLTKYAPYPVLRYSPGPVNQFIHDVPYLPKLKKWWNSDGYKNKDFNCPFDKIVRRDCNILAYTCFGESKERIDELINFAKIYPDLSRTHVEIGYLLLKDKSSFEVVEKFISTALAKNNDEIMPYLLKAYISLKNNDNKQAQINLEKAYQIGGEEKLFTSIQFHKKLYPLFNILDFK